jgi:hypothetical protein
MPSLHKQHNISRDRGVMLVGTSVLSTTRYSEFGYVWYLESAPNVVEQI